MVVKYVTGFRKLLSTFREHVLISAPDVFSCFFVVVVFDVLPCSLWVLVASGAASDGVGAACRLASLQPLLLQPSQPMLPEWEWLAARGTHWNPLHHSSLSHLPCIFVPTGPVIRPLQTTIYFCSPVGIENAWSSTICSS